MAVYVKHVMANNKDGICGQRAWDQHRAVAAMEMGMAHLVKDCQPCERERPAWEAEQARLRHAGIIREATKSLNLVSPDDPERSACGLFIEAHDLRAVDYREWKNNPDRQCFYCSAAIIGGQVNVTRLAGAICRT